MEILITIDWKTYKVVRKHSPVPSVLNTYIDSGDLEEVKENKEPQFYVWDIDISTGKPFKSGSTTQVCTEEKPKQYFMELPYRDNYDWTPYEWKIKTPDGFNGKVFLDDVLVKDFWVKDKPEEKTTYYKFPSYTEWRTEIEIPLWARGYYINWELYNWADTSILEKLREELERRINNEEWSTPYMEVKWELEEVLDFVNSLETPQFTPWQEEEWTPKKWEMVQVSDDGKYWSSPKKFIGMRITEWPFKYTTESNWTDVYWIHARKLIAKQN